MLLLSLLLSSPVTPIQPRTALPAGRRCGGHHLPHAGRWHHQPVRISTGTMQTVELKQRNSLEVHAWHDPMQDALLTSATKLRAARPQQPRGPGGSGADQPHNHPGVAGDTTTSWLAMPCAALQACTPAVAAAAACPAAVQRTRHQPLTHASTLRRAAMRPGKLCRWRCCAAPFCLGSASSASASLPTSCRECQLAVTSPQGNLQETEQHSGLAKAAAGACHMSARGVRHATPLHNLQEVCRSLARCAVNHCLPSLCPSAATQW